MPSALNLDDVAIGLEVGAAAFVRGPAYARSGRVLDLTVDAEDGLVQGTVRGSEPEPYEVTVELDPTGAVDWSEGSCFLGQQCKHVAAVLIAARRWVRAPAATPPAPAPSWEQMLDPLLAQTAAVRATSTIPLALRIEPTSDNPAHPLVLRCRPVRPGKAGKWVQQGVSWNDLEQSWRTEYDPVQRALLTQLRRLARDLGRYGYYGSEDWLDLTAAPPLVWNALTDLAAAGGVLVAGTRGPASIGLSTGLAELSLDVVADSADGGLAARPRLDLAEGGPAARRLGVGFTVAMTGTPLENSLMDLWAMLSLSAPGMFPSPDKFTELYRTPIEKSQASERLELLRRRIRPVLLRRTKEMVADDLPAKQEQVLEVDLHARHARIYQTQLQRERQKVLGLVDDLDQNRFTVLSSLTTLRQLSLSAGLVDEQHEGVPSAKIDLLAEMLPELVAEGHRALVFSQFTRFLRRIGDRLTGAGVPYSYLDGRTRSRGRVIEDFRSGGNRVFLISLKAGGFGLNLTEADYCFVCDPWWNPAAEAQAVDRAHRIGQTRPVMVYRLVSRDTIEEKVMALQARKRALFNSVIDDDGVPSGALTSDDIRGLLAG